MVSVDIVKNILKLEFSSSVMPVFIEKSNKDFIYYGEDNNYPAYLLDLYRRHPEHGAIIKAKCKYIYGKGLTINQEKVHNTLELAKAQSWLSRANRFEDWNSVFKKTVKSLEIFNGFVWQIIWNLAGTKCEVYHLRLANVRVSPCGKKYYYAKKWVDDLGKPLSMGQLERHGYQEFDAFDPNKRTGTQIYYYIEPEETTEEYGNSYSIPEYIQSVLNIATDVAVAEFQNNLVENGMSAQGMLSLFNGTPTTDEQKQYKKLFEKNYNGPKRAGRILFNFVNPGDNQKGAEYTTFTVSDMDKQFELIQKNNQQKIFTGHQVTNTQLFGISTPGALSDRSIVLESFEQMYNTYTEPRQEIPLGEITMIAGLCGVSLSGLEVHRLEPMGVDITDPNISKYFSEDEIREKLGYKPRVQQVQPGQPAPQAQVNEHIKALSGKDWIHIKRLIREVGAGKTTRAAASMLIKNAYGLTDEDLTTLFGDQQFRFKAEAEDAILALFLSAASDDTLDDVVSESYCFTKKQAFDDEQSRELKNNILDITKGNPLIKPDQIAKQLGVEPLRVTNAIKEMAASGLLEVSGQTITPTEKGINRDTPPVETETYTVYKYVVRPDVPKVKTETREFCKRMLAASEGGKVWTREALDDLTNSLGDDAWAYRGGWYTNPDTGETTTFCRHVWKSITKSRRKNA